MILPSVGLPKQSWIGIIELRIDIRNETTRREIAKQQGILSLHAFPYKRRKHALLRMNSERQDLENSHNQAKERKVSRPLRYLMVDKVSIRKMSNNTPYLNSNINPIL